MEACGRVRSGDHPLRMAQAPLNENPDAKDGSRFRGS